MYLSLFFQPDTSSVAVALANHYGVARLSIDAVVTDALINGTSPVSLKARQLYDSAVAKFEEKNTMEAGMHDPHANTHKYMYIYIFRYK